MKVILLQDVAKIGRRFEIKEVPDGYAQNKLIPQRQAEPATAANIKRVKAIADSHAVNEANALKAFKAAASALATATVTVPAQTNAEGKLFQALKPQAIVDAVKDAHGHDLALGWLSGTKPIKTAGTHTVLMSLGHEQAEFTVTVVSK